MNIKYFDIHCHLDLSDFDQDREEMIVRMQKEEIAAITVGVDYKTSEAAVKLAAQYSNIYACIGAHPTDSVDENIQFKGFDEKMFDELVSHTKVVAIGECGLDYYRLPGESRKIKEQQKDLFIRQIQFAQKHTLPLMIHGRPRKGTMDAYEDIIEIISNFQFPNHKPAGDVHFFVGNIQIARRFLDLGFSLSFDGPITFSREYDEVIRYIPAAALLAETDAPFAAPAPYRGKRNEPTYVKEIVSTLAQIRGEEKEILQEQLVTTAKRVFQIKDA